MILSRERRCTRCDAVYTPTGTYQKYCVACRSARALERSRAYRGQAEEPHAPRTCAECGQVFTPATTRHRYCTDACRTRAKRARYRGPAVLPRHPAYGNHGASPDHFTDETLAAELKRIAGELPAGFTLPDIPARRNATSEEEPDESGICPSCGRWYQWPLRREGGRWCSMACYLLSKSVLTGGSI